MSDFGFKKIKHNDWIGSSSEDEIQIKSFEPRNEKKNDEKDVEINEEKQISQRKVQSYDEAIALVEKYKDKKLSLKMKTLVKKAKKVIKAHNENKSKTSKKGKSDEERFSKGSSIFDTKKGQVLFELQKSYKGDSRFKLDERFAEDIEVAKLPNSIKLLTTDIDFKNLSDGSDTEFKSNSRKQKKIERKEEKKQQKLNQVGKVEGKEKKDLDNKKGGLYELENEGNGNDDDIEEEEFFVKKINNKDEEEDYNNQEEEDEEEEEEEEEILDEENSKQLLKNKTIHQQEEQLQQLSEEELYGQRFRETDDRDFIDQEGLESDVDSKDLPDELNGYIRILQDVLPEDKLFFQNKRKNLKIVNNSFAGYGTMLSKQEQIAVESKKKKKGNQKTDEDLKQEDGDDNVEDKKKNQPKDANETEDKIKKEKSYNLVIPRFDPSQYIVKKVMETQEKERYDKLKEKELGAAKKVKKITVEAQIEAGIDKKAQNIIKANSILDKNLTEHQKLEGIIVVKRKAPVLKKLKIDLEKWKNIIQSSMQIETNNTNTTDESTIPSTIVEQPKAISSVPAKVQNDKPIQPAQNHQQINKQQTNNSNRQSSTISSNLGFLFATAPSAAIDPSRNQFKLFG